MLAEPNSSADTAFSLITPQGYNVRATVRDPSKAEKVTHLKALGDALPGKLELYAADLLEQGSFDEAVRWAEFSCMRVLAIVLPNHDLLAPA